MAGESKFDGFDALAATFFVLAGAAFFAVAFYGSKVADGAIQEITIVLLAIGGFVCWGLVWLASVAAKR